MNDNLHPIFQNIVNSQLQLHDVVRSASASGCELMKCKYYVDGKCTDPNEWVNKYGDAVCGLREDAMLVE